MNIKKIIMVGLVAAASLALGEVAVTGVTAKQRYPWNGLVDITVTLSGTEEECAAATFPFYVTNKTTRTELPIGSVKAVGAIAGAGNTWTRRFVWNATADVGCAKFGEVELTVGAPSTGVQLWENGPYWAEFNVGATKPEESGYYFCWGDTVGCKWSVASNGWVSVKDGSLFRFDSSFCPTDSKSDAQLQSDGYIDSTGNLVPAHDAATTYLGVPWRMPTDAEWQLIETNCTKAWIVHNGVYGWLVAGKDDYASKSIFLPAVGIGTGSRLDNTGPGGGYWSATPGRSLNFRSGYFSLYDIPRVWGQSVRPLRGFAK